MDSLTVADFTAEILGKLPIYYVSYYKNLGNRDVAGNYNVLDCR